MRCAQRDIDRKILSLKRGVYLAVGLAFVSGLCLGVGLTNTIRALTGQ
jgi:hypothetical protein